MIKSEPSWTSGGPAVRTVPLQNLLLPRAGDNSIIHERAGTFLTYEPLPGKDHLHPAIGTIMSIRRPTTRSNLTSIEPSTSNTTMASISRSSESQNVTVDPQEENNDSAYLSLEQLREWRREEQEKAERETLLKQKEQIEAGLPPSEVFGDVMTQSTPPTSRNAMTSALPKPPDPETYSAASIANYNRWIQDCEGYFASSPRDFANEEIKCHFAARYLDRTRKGIWAEHKRQKEKANEHHIPTWHEMKQRMAECMGDLRIRRSHAYEQLKKAKQGRYTPTEFFDYLQAYWRELGETNETRMMEDYIAGLNSDVQDYLVKSAAYASINTVADAKSQANLAYIQLGRLRQAHYGPRRSKRNHSDNHVSGPQQTTPSTYRGHKRSRGSTSAPPSSSSSSRGKPTGKYGFKFQGKCHKCGRQGHMKGDCHLVNDSEKEETPKE